MSTCWKLLSVLTVSNLDKVGALLCRRNGTIIMVLNATGPGVRAAGTESGEKWSRSRPTCRPASGTSQQISNKVCELQKHLLQPSIVKYKMATSAHFCLPNLQEVSLLAPSNWKIQSRTFWKTLLPRKVNSSQSYHSHFFQIRTFTVLLLYSVLHYITLGNYSLCSPLLTISPKGDTKTLFG